MRGRRKDLLGTPQLHNSAQVNHCDVICQITYHRQIVRDEQIGGLLLALEIVQQIEDGRLYRHIQRRDRLVEQQQIRLRGEGTGNRHALLLAAAELSWQPPRVGWAELDRSEQAIDMVVHLRRRNVCEADQWPAENVANLEMRVERFVRVLKDHLQPAEHRAVARLEVTR
jgi:hypothetical protein